MRILFDVWIRDNGSVVYTQEQEALFEAVHHYIYDRLYLLIDEIDKEELREDEDKPKAIIVYLLKHPYAIQPARYSDELSARIIGSFNEKDAQLLWESVAKALSTFQN